MRPRTVVCADLCVGRAFAASRAVSAGLGTPAHTLALLVGESSGRSDDSALFLIPDDRDLVWPALIVASALCCVDSTCGCGAALNKPAMPGRTANRTAWLRESMTGPNT